MGLYGQAVLGKMNMIKNSMECLILIKNNSKAPGFWLKLLLGIRKKLIVKVKDESSQNFLLIEGNFQ